MQRLRERWQMFSSAPHRLFFFVGAIQALLTVLWWLSELSGRFTAFGFSGNWVIPAVDAHVFLMIYGFFAFFIFGFLMTTYPRWMQGDEVDKRLYIPAFLLLSGGILLFYIGLASSFLLLTLALIIFLTGWTVGLYALLQVYLRARHPDKRHATITTVMLILGWLMIAGFISGQFELVRLAKTGGVWLFLLPLFFAVSHRMIPFFTANVLPNYDIIRPYRALSLVLLFAIVHAIMEMCNLAAWLWLVDLPMAITGFYLLVKWQSIRSLAHPLLAMLHISFAWFGIAMLLYTLQSVYLCLSGEYILLRAPVHALVIGYFSSMLLAMITRVTLGHSGRPLVIDMTSWALFLCFQCVTIIRVVADFPGLSFLLAGRLYLLAGLLWLLCFGVWSYKYVPIYLKPRTNGRAG